MRVFLVRHGQSKANADWSENKNVADHAIELTDDGRKQARAAGIFLSKYFEDHLTHERGEYVFMERTRLWHSPYLRARQTADGIEVNCRADCKFAIRDEPDTPIFHSRKEGDPWLLDRREHVLLAEQQFGIFDGMSDEERAQRFPEMHAYYEKCKNANGKFWPKMPQGESRFEVAQRVHQAFGTFHRDADRHGINNIVVVAHGTTNRAFAMMWLHKSYEWMHEEPNPKNCSIRLIENGEDMGYIFKGFSGGQHAEQ